MFVKILPVSDAHGINAENQLEYSESVLFRFQSTLIMNNECSDLQDSDYTAVINNLYDLSHARKM